MANPEDIVDGSGIRKPADEPGGSFQRIWALQPRWQPNIMSGECAGGCGAPVESPEVWANTHDAIALGAAGRVDYDTIVGRQRLC